MNISSFLNKTGQFTRIVYRRKVKLRSGCGDLVEKRVTMVARAGVSYANMTGAPENPGPLPWGEWVPGYENRLIRHNGKMYVRVANPRPGTVEFFVNGNPVDKEIALANAVATEKKETNVAPLVINVDLDNVEELQ